MVSNYKNADYSIIKDFYRVISYNFRHTLFLYATNQMCRRKMI